MSQESKPLIWVKKVVQRKGQKTEIQDDIIAKKDIKRIRSWHRNEYDNDVIGPITQITIAGNPDITIKVNESLESLSKRLEIVHEVS